MRHNTLLGVIGSTVLCASAAWAQTAPPAPDASQHKIIMVKTRMAHGGAMMWHSADMCGERYFREIGHMAYLEAKLGLSAAQRPLFERWKTAKLENMKDEQGDCAKVKDTQTMQDDSIVTRLAHEEDHLKKRLADIQAQRPSLEALYNTLTAEQKTALDGPSMPGMADMKIMGDGPEGERRVVNRVVFLNNGGDDEDMPMPPDAPSPPAAMNH